MKKYKTVDVSEKQLEDLLRRYPEYIEVGLRYVDHQRKAERGPLDVLMADSGNALVLAELKVVEDDNALIQGIDYYDYIVRSIEGIARIYKASRIDPTQTVRLFLIAPRFSVALLNRCKWIDIPISLFTYKCISFEDPKDVVPVFLEMTTPRVPEVVKAYNLDERFSYITDLTMRRMVQDLIKEVASWDASRIAAEPTKYDISLKIAGRVFSYIGPRRKHFIVYTYDTKNNWTGFPIRQADDLEQAKALLKANVARLG